MRDQSVCDAPAHPLELPSGARTVVVIAAPVCRPYANSPLFVAIALARASDSM